MLKGTSNSLRSYYFIGAILMGVLVLSCAALAYKYVTDIRRQSIANLEMRNHLIEYSRLVREGVWDSDEALEGFLLDPGNSQHKRKVYASLKSAISNSRELSGHEWIATAGQAAAMSRLYTSLSTLNDSLEELMNTRVDPTRQYPGLAFSRQYMLPNHQKFYTAAELAITEIHDELQSESSTFEVYGEFVQARHLWTQMISNYRMYLANKVGSFDVSTLLNQEKETEFIYQGLMGKLDTLVAMDEAGELGLQAGESLGEMLQVANEWHKGFLEVKEIHSTDAWRADSKLLKDNIYPLYDAIWSSLLSIDTAMEQSAYDDVTTLSDVTKRQTQILWAMTFIGLLFIVFGYILLERLILAPITKMTKALHAKAKGFEDIDLPDATVTETRELADAFTEMSKQVSARQEELEHQALHDALTDLPNRTLLTDRLQQAIFTAKRGYKQLALLMIDLNGFKDVNDAVGHKFGDRLLIAVSARLQETLREVDTVARLGGDEFGILLPDSNEENARNVAGKICSAMEKVFLIDELQLYISASIGISLYPDQGENAETLIQRADVAMYVAKRQKTGFSVYDPQKDQNSIGKLALLGDLRNALDTDGLHLHYQPKINIATNEVIGVEALLRWDHEKFGSVRPDEIIRLAEQTSLIRPLSIWVVNTAIKQIKAWRENNIVLGVAVNLSVYNLQDSEFVDELHRCITEHDLPTHLLSMEITESAMMSNPGRAVEILTKLHMMGIKLSVDDFGTGFSSLAYLKQLPVSELKIDKSFVMDMTEDDNDAVIVRSTIDLAHNLGLKVVAEGVETEDILNLLEILRCDIAQGFHLCVPMAPAELEEWLTSRTDQNDKNNRMRLVK